MSTYVLFDTSKQSKAFCDCLFERVGLGPLVLSHMMNTVYMGLYKKKPALCYSFFILYFVFELPQRTLKFYDMYTIFSKSLLRKTGFFFFFTNLLNITKKDHLGNISQ